MNLLCRSATLAVVLMMGGVLAAEDFKGKDLSMRDFSNRNLAGSSFEDAKLFLARFNNAVLTKVNFQGADLTSASFNQAQASGADFRDAIFKNASMQSADLSEANFQETDLGNISFQSSQLKGANLRGCKGIGDVLKADLRDADLRGAVFTGTLYYMEGCRLKGAKYDKDTRWPQGFDVAASGAVLSASTDDAKPAAAGQTPLPAAPSASPRERDSGARKTPKLDGDTLTEEIIKHLLETEMWAGKDTRRFTFNYKSLKIAPSRKGKTLSDIASGKERIVTPVRVQVDMLKDQGNNQTSKTEIHQDYEFFRDEFGMWTYRFQSNL